MRLYTALSKLGVQVVRFSRSLLVRKIVIDTIFFLFLEVLQLLLLDDISELLSNELKLLLIENVNVLVFQIIFIKPVIWQHILSGSTLAWLFLKHGFHEVDCWLTYNVFLVFNFLIQLFYSVQISNLVCFERNIAV